MQLASINYKSNDWIGVRHSDAEVVLFDELDNLPSPLEMTDIVAAGPGCLGEISKLRDDPHCHVSAKIDQVTFKPPVATPGKIIGVAMNNSASNKRKISAPDHPAFFLKPSSCLIGHQDTVCIRSYYGSVHPEPELAVVIGNKTRDVDAINAMDCIFGYSIFNDITGNGMRADDLFRYWALYADETDTGKLERREQHLSYAARYKGTDTFGCMGPWLVTADTIPDPDNLDVRCHVGGDLVAEDNTRYYNYKVAELISYISQYLTLNPGDVISCGTAFKPGAGRKSIHHANLQAVPGPVVVAIDGLGTLVNPVANESRAIGQWRLSGDMAEAG